MVARPDFTKNVLHEAGTSAAVGLHCVGRFIFDAPVGVVTALGGIDAESLKALIDCSEHISGSRRIVCASMRPGGLPLSHVEHLIGIMADTALNQWPLWFGDVSFAKCRNNRLGRRAARVITREAAAVIPGLSARWAEAAVGLALSGKPPRVAGTLPVVELIQLSATLCGGGIVYVIELSEKSDDCSAMQILHALEWIAAHAQTPVIALFRELPPIDSAFERILHGARRVVDEANSTPPCAAPVDSALRGVWMLPGRGLPHPMSEIEQRMAKLLVDDPELAGLFHFNWTVTTVRHLRPRVDLVWLEGRLVVEFDGYPDHATRRAFNADRHRDYELALSGYSVLRLSNDEVVQDCGRAINKIRDLVRLRRQAMTPE